MITYKERNLYKLTNKVAAKFTCTYLGIFVSLIY